MEERKVEGEGEKARRHLAQRSKCRLLQNPKFKGKENQVPPSKSTSCDNQLPNVKCLK